MIVVKVNALPARSSGRLQVKVGEELTGWSQ